MHVASAIRPLSDVDALAGGGLVHLQGRTNTSSTHTYQVVSCIFSFTKFWSACTLLLCKTRRYIERWWLFLIICVMYQALALFQGKERGEGGGGGAGGRHAVVPDFSVRFPETTTKTFGVGAEEAELNKGVINILVILRVLRSGWGVCGYSLYPHTK